VTDENASNFGFLPEDYCADVNLTRQSLNGRLNSYGTQLLYICKQSGLRILNGRVGDDQNIGKYTYVASTGSSVVDYVISTPNMFNYIRHFAVHEPNILSDHCIVDFDLTFEKRIVADGTLYANCINPHNSVDCKYVWDNTKVQDFHCKLNSSHVLNLLHDLNSCIENALNYDDINGCVQNLSTVIDNVMSDDFKRNTIRSSRPKDVNSSKNDWYTQDCYNNRNLFYASRNLYRNDRSHTNRDNMVRMRSNYKTCIKIQNMFLISLRPKNLSARLINAKLYLEIVKGCMLLKGV